MTARKKATIRKQHRWLTCEILKLLKNQNGKPLHAGAIYANILCPVNGGRHVILPEDACERWRKYHKNKTREGLGDFCDDVPEGEQIEWAKNNILVTRLSSMVRDGHLLKTNHDFGGTENIHEGYTIGQPYSEHTGHGWISG